MSDHGLVLTWHSIDRSGRLFSTTPETFLSQLDTLVHAGLPLLPLRQLFHQGRGIALTFDDADATFLDIALPALLERRLPATLFAVSGRAGRHADWPSSDSSHPRDLLLDWPQLRAIAGAGIEIGSHSVSHSSLPTLSPSDAARELADSRAELEHRLGCPVPVFAYPYGHSSPALHSLAAQHYELACGTRLAPLRPSQNPFDLPRAFEFYLRSPFCLRHILSPAGPPYLALRHTLSRLRALT